MIKRYIKLSIIGIIIAITAAIILNIVDMLGLIPEFPEPGNGKEILNINFQKKYQGIITEKYLDSNNHLKETIGIRLIDSSEYFLPKYGDQYLAFYNYIHVGDSILKKDWGFKFYIKRDSVETSFILSSDYNE